MVFLSKFFASGVATILHTDRKIVILFDITFVHISDRRIKKDRALRGECFRNKLHMSPAMVSTCPTPPPSTHSEYDDRYVALQLTCP